jgi:hypothetical protein
VKTPPCGLVYHACKAPLRSVSLTTKARVGAIGIESLLVGVQGESKSGRRLGREVRWADLIRLFCRLTIAFVSKYEIILWVVYCSGMLLVLVRHRQMDLYLLASCSAWPYRIQLSISSCTTHSTELPNQKEQPQVCWQIVVEQTLDSSGSTPL